MSRLAKAAGKPLVRSMERSFSSFDFIEAELSPEVPIQRLFSIARILEANLVVLEDVPAEGAVADENDELLRLYPDYECRAVKRLTFWKTGKVAFDATAWLPGLLREEDCLGCAILKLDAVASRGVTKWHVFEAVMTCVQSRYHCHPAAHEYDFAIRGRVMKIRGFLYCQQNGLNKVCAQVALRSLCAPYLGNLDLPFSTINQAARESVPGFRPDQPWQTAWIKAVLDKLGIDYLPLDYESNAETFRDFHPYQFSVYAGVECGAGALLAFNYQGRRKRDGDPGEEDSSCGDESKGHVIPCYGHTFNQDAWAPNADAAYFKVGSGLSYIPSSSLMSSIIVHDDNFGPNLATPQHFIPPAQVGLVIALNPPGYRMFGKHAEVLGALYLEKLVELKLLDASVPWIRRLLEHRLHRRRMVFRAVPISWTGYLLHLATVSDWDYGKEAPAVLEMLRAVDKGPRLWLVEFSIPDLFSANRRRIGEFVIEGGRDWSHDKSFAPFILARFPGSYVFLDTTDSDEKLPFYSTPSSLRSHVELLPATRQ